MARVAASAAAKRIHAELGARPGVEPGVTGKERQFQQNRQFGPGPIKPFLAPAPTGPRVKVGDGVYRGGSRPGELPTVPGYPRRVRAV